MFSKLTVSIPSHPVLPSHLLLSLANKQSQSLPKREQNLQKKKKISVFVNSKLTNCLFALTWIVFLVELALSSPSSLSRSLLAEKTNRATESPILECLLEDDKATVADQLMAMKALKDSLGIADNMGWNGDPCHPTCWEGVKCKPNPLGSGLVISEIDLQNQGLAGFITKDIKLLTNLISLNLSNNYLSGPIPTDVHSIHLRGGSFNVSENRGLCGLGLPSAPRQCSTLSMMGRETKGLTSFVVFIVLWLSYIPFGMPGIHDENDPIHHIAFQEGRVRIKMAGIYSLFHWVRVKMMKWYIPEPAFDIGQAYKLWSLSRVLELVYGLVGIFAVFSVLLSRSTFTKLSHRFALVSIFTWALSQSIKAIMLIYDQPWLMLLETVWLLRTLIFSIFVINRPPAFDMRIWNSHVMIVVLGVIQSLELFDYITITVVIIVWLVWLVFTMGT